MFGGHFGLFPIQTGGQNDATIFLNFFSSPGHNLLNTPKSQAHRLKRSGSILHYNVPPLTQSLDFNILSTAQGFSQEKYFEKEIPTKKV